MTSGISNESSFRSHLNRQFNQSRYGQRSFVSRPKPLTAQVLQRHTSGDKVHIDGDQRQEYLETLSPTRSKKHYSKPSEVSGYAETMDHICSLVVQIEESGPGYNAEELDTIFRPFTKLSTSLANDVSPSIRCYHDDKGPIGQVTRQTQSTVGPVDRPLSFAVEGQWGRNFSPSISLIFV